MEKEMHENLRTQVVNSNIQRALGDVDMKKAGWEVPWQMLASTVRWGCSCSSPAGDCHVGMEPLCAQIYQGISRYWKCGVLGEIF